MTQLKLGRKPRLFDPRVPRYHAMRALAPGALPALETALDQCAGLPKFLGMMLNNLLGCCTCSAVFHAIQVWSEDAQGAVLTEPDAQVEQLYEAFGYNPRVAAPGEPNYTDGGVEEQRVLGYWLNTGAPMADGSRHRITAYAEVEVDPDLLCEVVQEFGVCYVGALMPEQLMLAGPPAVWDADPAYENHPAEGHAFLLSGFDRSGGPGKYVFKIITWGADEQYTVTEAFVRKYVDEAYAIVDPLWIEKTGKTPLGLDLAALEALMGALRTEATVDEIDPGAIEAARHGVARSPHWPTVEREYKTAHPDCAAGGRGPVQAHHKLVSFHIAVLLGRPDLELDERNLISLTEGPDEAQDGLYHLLLGHGDDFRKDCNPAVDKDVVTFHGVPCRQIRVDPRWQAHAAACPPPWDEWTPEMKAARRAVLDAALPPSLVVLSRFDLIVEPYAG